MNNNDTGKVYLVGAGPGDPDLLTVKAKRLLTRCDALVYDSLIPKEFLKLTPNLCRHFFVGKRRGKHSLDQMQINKFLMEISKDHKLVVRLKGGDPFLFGRGAEEAEWLIKHNIQVEVVPGITSGIAAPAYMGIPLTHRDTASSVTFVTGHEGNNKRDPSIKWRSLANASDGIVIYMGMHNLHYIIHELIAGGLDPETPSAIIHNGTLSNQQCIKAPLNKLLLKQRSKDIKSPSIIVIGKVINHQIEKCAPVPADLSLSELKALTALEEVVSVS